MTGINRYFEAVLGARVKNHRWSWGAFDENNNRVYLRVWGDEIVDLEGVEFIRVLNLKGVDSNAYRERKKHLDLVFYGGASCYGVSCLPADSDNNRIKSFDRDRLFVLGKAIERESAMLMCITGFVTPEELQIPASGWAGIGRDLAVSVELGSEQVTVREAMGLARIGQGIFRSRVIDAWSGRCAVSGVPHLAVLRASHIKPWSRSTNSERLDPHNGLLLCANLDALFDAGDIGFRGDGAMEISPRISDDLIRELGLGRGLLQRPSLRMQEYLAYHRENIFASGALPRRSAT